MGSPGTRDGDGDTPEERSDVETRRDSPRHVTSEPRGNYGCNPVTM